MRVRVGSSHHITCPLDLYCWNLSWQALIDLGHRNDTIHKKYDSDNNNDSKIVNSFDDVDNIHDNNLMYYNILLSLEIAGVKLFSIGTIGRSLTTI